MFKINIEYNECRNIYEQRFQFHKDQNLEKRKLTKWERDNMSWVQKIWRQVQMEKSEYFGIQSNQIRFLSLLHVSFTIYVLCHP